MHVEGETRERVDWHRIVVGLPSLKTYVLERVMKGDRLLVMGSIQYKEYFDENRKRSVSTYITAGTTCV